MKRKILVILASIAIIAGLLSGCLEEEKTTTTENTAPVASFTITQEGLTVTCDASDSSDADDDDITYTWTFGDEVAGTGEGLTPSYTYAASDTYTVTLTVSDGTDVTSVSHDVTVTNPPTVVLRYLPETITNDTAITFTATATAGDAEINETTGYRWFIEDDTGEVEQIGETTMTFIYTFEVDGEYTVKVIVTDEDGLADEASVTFVVPTTPE